MMTPAFPEYKPSLLFRNGHINTLFPYFFRKLPVPWTSRERIQTPDGDFFDVDRTRDRSNKRLLVLLHGLEGSSLSQYMKAFGLYFSQHDYDVAAVHFRSCSGDINQGKVLYHSGYTDDIRYFLNHMTADYTSVFLCGFSLGGSVCINTLGRYPDALPANLKAATAVSVPLDLFSSAKKLLTPGNTLYVRRFLSSLKAKMKLKHQQYPADVDVEALENTKNLWDFDEYFTAPLHGFSSAEDYYRSCSARPYLNQIKIPVVIVNSRDDSFLTRECMPASDINTNLYSILPPFGGHVGFSQMISRPYWIELTVHRFFQSFI